VDLFFRIAFGCAWGALVLVWAWGWRMSKPTSRAVPRRTSITAKCNLLRWTYKSNPLIRTCRKLGVSIHGT
jgi:hypothetical protein